MSKKYYAILNSDGHMTITRNYDLFLDLTLKKSVKTKSFKDYNKALEWLGLEIIRNNVAKYYAIYYPKENMRLILLNRIYLKNYTEKKHYNMKAFKNISEALEWLNSIINIKIDKYYSNYYPYKNYGVIYLDNPVNKIDKTYNLEKKFNDVIQANNWIILNMKNKYKCLNSVLKDVIYFDSGTGRGSGTEIKVTDYLGNSLLDKIRYDKFVITKYNTINIGNIDNSYGELYGLYLALKVALETGIKKIAGDSQTILYRWTNGYYKNSILEEKKDLIEKTITLKTIFLNNGGEIYYIRGKINPADLGFHK